MVPLPGGGDIGPRQQLPLTIILLVKLIDKAGTNELLEKLGVSEILGIRVFCHRDFLTQLIQYDSKPFQCGIGFDGKSFFNN